MATFRTIEPPTEGTCPLCNRPYGARRRCYYCNGPKKRSGEMRVCQQCGKQFYAAQWQITDRARNQATYCSRGCQYDSMRISGPGAKQVRGDGYVQVYYPAHPDASKAGWMLEHRLVAEQKYGRRILKTEHVHHVNYVRDDNRPENLEIIPAGKHAGISTRRGQQLRAEIRGEVERLRAELAEYRRRYGPLPEED